MSLPPNAVPLERGDFVRLCYRLGHGRSTGVLTIAVKGGKLELVILRHGQVFTRDSDPLGRRTRQRLERLATAARAVHFDAGLAAYPPSLGRPFSLTRWAREHLESQIDSVRAQELVRELAGTRLHLVHEELPDRELLDAADERILQVMRTPRRLDQIWPLARAPRFRLITFLHFLRAVGAVREAGVATSTRAPIGTSGRRSEAMRILGVSRLGDRAEVKRAYRRLARELHPDLNCHASAAEKRQREQRLADVNSAYRELMQAP